MFVTAVLSPIRTVLYQQKIQVATSLLRQVVFPLRWVFLRGWPGAKSGRVN